MLNSKKRKTNSQNPTQSEIEIAPTISNNSAAPDIIPLLKELLAKERYLQSYQKAFKDTYIIKILQLKNELFALLKPNAEAIKNQAQVNELLKIKLSEATIQGFNNTLEEFETLINKELGQQSFVMQNYMSFLNILKSELTTFKKINYVLNQVTAEKNIDYIPLQIAAENNEKEKAILQKKHSLLNSCLKQINSWEKIFSPQKAAFSNSVSHAPFRNVSTSNSTTYPNTYFFHKKPKTGSTTDKNEISDSEKKVWENLASTESFFTLPETPAPITPTPNVIPETPATQNENDSFKSTNEFSNPEKEAWENLASKAESFFTLPETPVHITPIPTIPETSDTQNENDFLFDFKNNTGMI